MLTTLLSYVYFYLFVVYCSSVVVVVVVVSLCGDVDLQVASYTEFGKNFPKEMKMSPDGFMQNAILLTYYK